MPSIDDDSLRSMLDALSSSEGMDAASPERPLALSSIHASDPVFKTSNLASGISLANSLIANAGVTTRIQALADETVDAMRSALASALGIIATLVRSREANTTLRCEAEKKLQNVKDERDRALQVAERLEGQIEQRESNLRSLKLKLEDVENRDRAARKRALEEITSLRSKIAALSRREAALAIETKKKDKEYAKLQERVHGMLARRGAIAPPQISITSAYRAPVIHVTENRDDPDDHEEYERFVESAYEERQGALLFENEEYRSLLRAVQEELDDLVRIGNGRDGAHRAEDTSPQSRAIDVAQEDSAADASCNEQMVLPFQVIRDDLERSFEQNIQILKSRLESDVVAAPALL